jgi:hypothetical protein
MAGESLSRLVWAKSETFSKIMRAKRAGDMAQVLECLLWQVQNPKFKPQYSPPKKEKYKISVFVIQNVSLSVWRLILDSAICAI